MTRNAYAAALAADFRANGIYRGDDAPKGFDVETRRALRAAGDNRLYDGPVCFYCNNVPGSQWEGFMDTQDAIVAQGSSGSYGNSVVRWLNGNDDDTVLAFLDSLNA